MYIPVSDPKHRLVSQFQRVPKINVLSINVKNIFFFRMKFSIFTATRIPGILFGCVFVMPIAFMPIFPDTLRFSRNRKL